MINKRLKECGLKWYTSCIMQNYLMIL
jgi:hypothetical protein